MRPTRAMVLAAGLGLRLRPITAELPKPLVAVGGHTMLDRALDHLAASGVEFAIVNCHYHSDQIEAHLGGRDRPRTVPSRETTLLDTGGGVAKALPVLGPDPFFVVNADVVWRDGRRKTLERLADGWRGADMDALVLLHPTVKAFGYDGDGDFTVDQLGRVRRRDPNLVAPYVFTGMQILHPRLFDGAPAGAFSLNLLYDRAIEAGRLFAIVHDGDWFHIGTPEALSEADEELSGRPGARSAWVR